MNVDLLESFFSLGGSGYRVVLFFPRHVHFGPDRLKREKLNANFQLVDLPP
jgi:hypothetical protein